MAFFIVTVVKTSNPTQFCRILYKLCKKR
jgi:hypothetical protein